MGLGAVPEAFFDACNQQWFDSNAVIPSVGVRIGVAFGALGVEARSSHGARWGNLPCSATPPRSESGIATDTLRIRYVGSYSASGLHARYETGAGPVWFASGGGGYVWSHDVPFLALSAGLRGTTQIHWIVEGGVRSYHTSVDVVTREWDDGVVVDELSRTRLEEWRTGWTLTTGVGIRL